MPAEIGENPIPQASPLFTPLVQKKGLPLVDKALQRFEVVAMDAYTTQPPASIESTVPPMLGAESLDLFRLEWHGSLYIRTAQIITPHKELTSLRA